MSGRLMRLLGATAAILTLADAAHVTAETVFQVGVIGDPAPTSQFPTFSGPVELVALDRLAVFTDGRVWRTDGTTRGTTLLVDAWTGGGLADVKHLVRAGSLVYFVADDGSHGYELWRTDGTPRGTTIVQDICPGSCDGVAARYWYPPVAGFVAAAGQAVVFVASDGLHGDELWRSDGTATGTRLLADLRAGSDGSGPGALVTVGDLVFFSAGGDLGAGLWRTDGTAAGTVFLGSQGLASAALGTYAVRDAEIFFASPNGALGVELWASDGTPAGTRMLADVCNGECSGLQDPNLPSESMAVVGRTVYFAGYRPETGVELWTTDGSAAGTRLLQECNPGPASGVWSLVSDGERLFAIAEDGAHGPELWVAPPGGGPRQ